MTNGFTYAWFALYIYICDKSCIRYFVEYFTWQEICGIEQAKNTVLYFIWCVTDHFCVDMKWLISVSYVCEELTNNAIRFKNSLQKRWI